MGWVAVTYSKIEPALRSKISAAQVDEPALSNIIRRVTNNVRSYLASGGIVLGPEGQVTESVEDCTIILVVERALLGSPQEDAKITKMADKAREKLKAIAAGDLDADVTTESVPLPNIGTAKASTTSLDFAKAHQDGL